MQPWEYLDDSVSPCDVLVIGCGNILRGDDAAGPVLIRRLWELPQFAPSLDPGGQPEPSGAASAGRVRLVDGGTAGMDVAFQMRAARRCIIVDACTTGAQPGTVYRVPADQVASLPGVKGASSHDFRWDNAIGLGRWLLGPLMPDDIEVYLIEAGSLGFGDPLSDAVSQAVDEVARLIVAETSLDGTTRGETSRSNTRVADINVGDIPAAA